MCTRHDRCVDVRRTEYLSLFLQLRSPLSSTHPLLDYWRDFIEPLVGDVEVFGQEVSDGSSHTILRTPLSRVNIAGGGDLMLTSTDAVPTPARIEFLVQLNYNHDTICCSTSFGPSVLLVFGLSYMSEQAMARLDSVVVDRFAECAHLVSAKYGLIDIADSMETGIGRWLGASDQLYASFQRRLMRRLWAEEAGREPRALGVFWANLLGREMTERLGDLTRSINGSRPLFEETGPPLLRESADGSAIILLSPRITDFVYPRLGITWRQFDRAAWLHRRLASAGLLAGRR